MIEFIEEGHIYLNSYGIIVPSVSELVQFATGDDYSNIPKHILRNACEFGTDIHNAIEKYFKENQDTEFTDIYRELAYKEFKKLYKEFINDPICELGVDYNERYCGRVDCISNDILIDYKTNSKLNIPHLEWQMGFYKLALKSKGVQISHCKCLWLPKRKSGQWVDINPKTKEECLEILKQYEDKRNNED